MSATRFCFTIKEKILSFARNIWVFIFGGERCLCCGKYSGVIPVCSECEKVLIAEENSFFDGKFCSVCGKPLLSEISLCSECRNSPVVKSPSGVFPVFTYRLWKKNLLFAWKTEGKRCLSPFFARFVYKRICSVCKFLNKDEILPVVIVPPRPGKVKKKGWDQMQDISLFLRKFYGINVLDVIRRISVVQQKKLSRESRLERMSNSYILRAGKEIRKFLLSPPEEVILIDDVMTTGSTAEACSEILKSAGVKKVYIITLFIVD